MCCSAGRACAAMLAAIACIACTSAVHAAPPSATGAAPLLPGERVGGMTLARVGYTDGLVSIFDFCNPLLYAPALYHRHCTVPRARRLFIGYGDFEATLPALEKEWLRERWELHVDGHEVRLSAFGTDDRALVDYPPGTYGNSILREWRVLLVNPSRGRHLIRYVTHEGRSVTDVTFTVWVR
jgi:hypothetical protein